MNWKTLALGSVMVGAAFAGCGNSPAPAGDANVQPDGSMPAATRTYVIGLLRTAAADSSQAYGFDLDNMVGGPAGTCQAASDYTDPYPPHGMGIDNQLVSVLPLIASSGDGADGLLRDQIENGKLLLILQVSGITSYAETASVGVHAYLGVVQTPACTAHADMTSCAGDTANHCAWAANTTGGGTCNGAPMPSTVCAAHHDMASCTGDTASACNWGGTAMTCTGIAANQPIKQLTDLGNVMGSIHNHTLVAVTDNLPLSFTAMGHAINLTLHSVHFRGDITADTIQNGEFGAQVIVADVFQLADTIMPGFLTRTLLDSVAPPDLLPITGAMAPCMMHTDMTSCTHDYAEACSWMGSSGPCMGPADNAECGAISAGMGYTAIATMLTM